MVRRSNGLPSTWHAFEIDWSETADWNTSSVIPPKKSVVTTAQEGFKYACLSTSTVQGSEKFGFQENIDLLSLSVFFAFPPLLPKDFGENKKSMLHILSVCVSLTVRKRGAKHFEINNFKVEFELFLQLDCGDESFGRDEATTDRSSPPPLQNCR
jgi:hypothetical protein